MKSAFLPLLAMYAIAPICLGQEGSPLTSPGSLQARIRFQHLTSADGLSQDSVFAILQDRQGFMWFATQGGLNRYDGAAITQYRHDPRNPNSLSSDFITDMVEDEQGSLWFCWFASPGLNRFDPKTGKFTRYLLARLPQVTNDTVTIRKLHQGRDGVLWLTSASRILYRFDRKSESFTEFDIGAGEPSNSAATSVQEDSSGAVWIGTTGGLVQLDPHTKGVRFHKRSSSNDPGAEAVSAIAVDNAQKMYVAYGAHLSQFDPQTRRFVRDWPWTGGAQTLLADPSGLLWVGTTTGLRLFDPGTGVFRTLVHDPADRYSLSASDVMSLRRDREGNLWVGTKSGGLNQFSPEILRFGAWRKEAGGVDTLSQSNVRAIRADRSGVVWLGTFGGGLNRFEPASGKFQTYRQSATDPRNADHNQIYSIYQDRQGTLWTGNNIGLGRFNPESGAFRHFESNSSHPRVYSILEDRRGRFWLGSHLTFDRRTETFAEAVAAGEAKGYLNVFEDHEGNIWSSAGGGIRKLDNTGISREIPLARTVDSGGPPRVQVNFVHEDSAGTLWLATETGLVHLDPVTEKYTEYTTQEGLPDNIVQCILPDDGSNLWISTSKGLSRFNPKDRTFFNYSESDGLQGRFFNRKSCFRDEAGWMYFGGLNGFNRFHPKQILNSPLPPPPVVITKLQIQGNTVPVTADSLLAGPGLQLRHDRNELYFEFAALSYANPAKIRYRFKLEGLEDRWTTLEAQQRNARYAGLRPNEYVFRVQASTDGGVTWGEQGASLHLEIAPPWWNTPWTRSIFVLSLIGLIAGIYKLRVNALHRQQLLLERLVQKRTGQLVEARDQAQAANQRAEEATSMKSMFLANMSHEIRTPMNAVIGMAYLALKTPLSEKQRDYISKIHNAGTSLLGVINDILDFSKIEAGKLDIAAAKFQLDRVIASVTSITAQEAQEKGLELLVEIQRNVPQDLVGDPMRLGQIITNLVNNAVKFTERGEVHIKVELLERTGARAKLQFSISDTGIGMTPEQTTKLFQPFSQADMSATRTHGGTGLGLTICRRLVELMAGEIWFESKPGVGSTFFFTIWAGAAPGTPRQRIVPEELRRISALVVDDSETAREILVHNLRSLCSHVDAVESGEEAIFAVKRNDEVAPYDVVFMDWRMPGINGLEATRLIKADPGLHTIPAVVLVTAFGQLEVRENAERELIDGFLLKPVTTSMLMDTLVNIFAAARGEWDSAQLASAADRHANSLVGIKILLAEDNEINQQIAVELLEGAGASVEVANDGLEAVGKLLAQPGAPVFDVVLMDMQMPRLDGYEATRRLRAEPRLARLPIIAITAHATVEERQKCLDAGMDAHVPKPIDPSTLFDTIRRFVKPTVQSPIDAPAVISMEDALPDLDCLNTADGLARMAGNRKLYTKLLSQFAAQEADAAHRIGAALNGHDRLLAERLAHTVKGTAGNLGATAVQNAAANLEKAIARFSPAADIESLRDSLGKSIAQLIAELRTVLPGAQDEAPQAQHMTELIPVIEQLSHYLAESDGAAVEYLESVTPRLRSIFQEAEFESFAALVESYSFSEALDQLRTASERHIERSR